MKLHKFYSLTYTRYIIKSRVDFQFELTRRRCIILIIIICVDVAAVATTTAGKVGGTSDIDKKTARTAETIVPYFETFFRRPATR